MQKNCLCHVFSYKYFPDIISFQEKSYFQNLIKQRKIPSHYLDLMNRYFSKIPFEDLINISDVIDHNKIYLHEDNKKYRIL